MINRFSKIRYIILIFILAFLYCSCDDSSGWSGEGSSSRELLLSFDAVSRSSAVSDNTDVYVFNSSNLFHHKVLNVVRTSESMTMNMPAGTWNLVLVGCLEQDIRQQLISPNTSAERLNLPMWRTTSKGDGTFPDAPEIRTALIDNLSITANINQTATASLERNVAKIRVILDDGVGFAIGSDNTVSLKEVPTTLSWGGSLYPNKDNPEVGTMSDKHITLISFTDKPGHVKSQSPVEFIIPAHKSKSSGDVSTHKMKLAVKFKTLSSDTYFSKTIEVQTIPQCNQIVELHLTAKGGIEIEVKVAPWTTVPSTYNPELFTFLQKGKTETLATYTMEMKQERNWWVTLDDTANFEFVDGTAAFGQFTSSPATIQVRRKAGRTTTGNMSTKLNLYISGFDGWVQQYDVTNLKQ
jgi:hypothetical protein